MYPSILSFSFTSSKLVSSFWQWQEEKIFNANCNQKLSAILWTRIRGVWSLWHCLIIILSLFWWQKFVIFLRFLQSPLFYQNEGVWESVMNFQHFKLILCPHDTNTVDLRINKVELRMEQTCAGYIQHYGRRSTSTSQIYNEQHDDFLVLMAPVGKTWRGGLTIMTVWKLILNRKRWLISWSMWSQ